MDSNDGALAKQQIFHQIQIQNNSIIKQRYFEIYLKELQTKVIFVSAKKIGENTNNISRLLFFHNKFTLCHTRTNIFI